MTPIPPSPVSGTANLLSVLVGLPVLGISYPLNHTVRGLLHLAFFTQRNVFEVHPCCGVYENFIFMAE